MKKSILIVVALLVSVGVYAKEFVVYSGTYYDNNDIWNEIYKKSYTIKYESSNDTFLFDFTKSYPKAILIFNQNNLIQLRQNLQKYFDWYDLAIKKQAKLKKEFPNSQIKVRLINPFGDSVYTTDNFILHFIFSSKNIETHHLIIESDPIESSESYFFDCEMNDVLFTYNEVQALRDFFTEENIEKVKQAVKEQEELEALFN